MQQFYWYVLATGSLSRKWSYSEEVQMTVYDMFIAL